MAEGSGMPAIGVSRVTLDVKGLEVGGGGELGNEDDLLRTHLRC